MTQYFAAPTDAEKVAPRPKVKDPLSVIPAQAGIQTPANTPFSGPHPKAGMTASSAGGATSGSHTPESILPAPAPDPNKKSRRTLWIVIILLILFALGALLVKIGYDARLARLEADQQAQQAATEAADQDLQDQLSTVKVTDDSTDTDVSVTDETEPASDSSVAPTVAGIQGTNGAAGASGAPGQTGPQGPSGTATCPNGSCLSLQPTSPGSQEVGNLNISGDGIFGGDVGATSFTGDGANLTNIDAETLDGNDGTYYTNAGNLNTGTLGDARLSANVALQNAANVFTAQNNFNGGILQNGNQVCDDSNNCNYAAATGGAGYIQNGTSPQTANFNVTGTGVIGGNATVGGLLQLGSNQLVLRQDPSFPFQMQVDGAFNVTSLVGIGTNAVNGTRLYVKNIDDTSSTSALRVENTSGNATFLVNGDGNVGIGTNNPGYKLEVNGNLRAGATGNNILGPNSLDFGGNTQINGDYLRVWNLSNGPMGQIRFGFSDTNGASINGQNNAGLSFNTNNTERVRIDNSGNVGIGTASPWEALSLPYNSQISLGASTLYNFNIYKSAAGSLHTYFDSRDTDITNAVHFRMRTGGTPVDALSILGSGNVGIGNTNPVYNLDVAGDINISGTSAYKIAGTNICTSAGCTAASGSGNYIQNGTSPQSANFNITGQATIGGVLAVDGGYTVMTDVEGDSLLLGAPATADRFDIFMNGGVAADQNLLIYGSDVATGFQLGSFGVQALTSSFTGNVGVGTTGPSRKLEVAVTGNEGIRISNVGNAIGDFAVLDFVQAGAQKGVIYTNNDNFIINSNGAGPLALNTTGGNVGIGTTSPQQALDVHGFSRVSRSNAGWTEYYDTSAAAVQGYVGWGSAGDLFTNGLTNALNIRGTNSVQLGVGSGAMLTIASSGNVGIGTTAPGARLHVQAIDTSAVGQIVQGASGQTADLQQWQNSTGRAVAGIDAGGNIYTQTAAATVDTPEVTGADLILQSARWNGSSSVNEAIRFSATRLGGAGAANAQSLFVLHTDGNVPLTASSGGRVSVGNAARFDSFNLNQQLSVTSDLATNIGIVVKGASGQTANLLQLQDSNANVLSRFNSAGMLSVNEVNAASASALTVKGTSLLDTGAAGQIGLIVRGRASQTANLLEVQNNAAALQFYVSATSGSFSTRHSTLQAAGSYAYANYVPGDTQARFAITGAGSINWGDGTNVTDTNLYRDSANVLRTNDSFQVDGNFINLGSAYSLGVGSFGDSNSSSYQLRSVSTLASRVGFMVKGAVSQSADLLQAQDSTGAVLAKVDASGNLTVKDAEVQGDLTVTGTIETANIIVNGKIIGNADTRGSVTITNGNNSISHNFATPYASAPNVVATPMGDPGSAFWVSNVTTTGFTINTSSAVGTDVDFNWQAQE